MSDDITAYPKKMASDAAAAAVAAAASATTSPTSLPVASATGLEARRIVPASRHSSFSVRLLSRSAAATVAPSPPGLRHALPEREQRRIERAVGVGEHEEPVEYRSRNQGKRRGRTLVAAFSDCASATMTMLIP
ncbi:hypothetical protein E2562_000708 [Oryza meyeriana var. granulata]|uniref:Uncharacterized protein n=1 Tax=Oryza meyeriana var. granulata TaxID=110450 RepID=A0A6G1DUE5_9ORYZ|nr:hypothetical protein E2562_000708 [Oryza meyeriana var. granulata]